MEDSLVGRRSKRSTAGNRMEAALAEMSVDDLMQDIEEDIDFISKVEEEDVFESDFASTDEDVEQGDDEVVEKALQDEEKRAKRASRRTYVAPKPPPARKVAFGSPVPDGDAAKTPKARPKRVSLGQAVDAETGEVLETNKRQSTREATRLNARELQSRLKIAEGRRASLTKKPKEIERRKRQDELIRAALDMEDDNIKSHRNYLANEEERRKKARVVKASTVGPKLRWRSRVEEVSVTVYDPAPQVQRPSWTSPYAPAQPGVPYHNPYSIPPAQPASGSATGTTQTQQPLPSAQYPFAYAPQPARTPPTNATASTSKQSPTPAAQPTTQQQYANQYYPYSYYTPQTQQPHSPYQPYGPYYAYQPQPQHAAQQQPRPHLQLHPQASVPRKTTEKQVRNYVEHLVDEERPLDKPGWRETMDALFGEHVDWDNVKVYVGKNRPTARQIQTCPITGLQARYRDPRTGVPYANAGAFRILTRLLAHEYVWSPAGAPGAVGVFVGHEKQRGAVGVPDSWGEAMAGVEEGWRKKRVDGRRDEKAKEREREVRVGERRSSRIAGEVGEVGEKGLESERMDVDKGVETEGAREDGGTGEDAMVVEKG